MGLIQDKFIYLFFRGNLFRFWPSGINLYGLPIGFDSLVSTDSYIIFFLCFQFGDGRWSFPAFFHCCCFRVLFRKLTACGICNLITRSLWRLFLPLYGETFLLCRHLGNGRPFGRDVKCLFYRSPWSVRFIPEDGILKYFQIIWERSIPYSVKENEKNVLNYA